MYEIICTDLSKPTTNLLPKHQTTCEYVLKSGESTHHFLDDIALLQSGQRAHVVIEKHGQHLRTQPLLLAAAHHGGLRQRDDAERRVHSKYFPAAKEMINKYHDHKIKV